MSHDAATVACACGRPLHYTRASVRAWVESQIAQHGPTILVSTPTGSWRVPRHYIALHGLKAADLPRLASVYGWARV